MSLDKAIQSGKEKRKQYRKSKAVDRSCRNHGSCAYCEQSRMHKHKKKLAEIEYELKEYMYEQV